MTVENKSGFIQNAGQKVLDAWQYLRRGYSDSQVAQWREITSGIITADHIRKYRERMVGVFFVNKPLSPGQQRIPSPEFSPAALTEWATGILNAPEDKIKDEVTQEAWNNLAYFGLLARFRAGY